MGRHSRLPLAALALVLSLAACNGGITPQPAATARPSPTALPTAVPIGGPTTIPTAAPTPAPSATARPSPTAPPTAIPPTAPAPTRRSALPADPLAAISQAIRAQLKAMPFSAQSKITSGATTVETFVEFESRQRVRVTTTNSTAVLYDGKFYVKEGQAAWREDSRAAAINGFLAGMLDSAGVEAVIGMIKTDKQVGSETLDGIPCRVYEYTYAGEQFGVQTQGKVRLWVAEDDALPIKQVTESEAAGYSATSTVGYDYGPSLTVDPPIK